MTRLLLLLETDHGVYLVDRAKSDATPTQLVDLNEGDVYALKKIEPYTLQMFQRILNSAENSRLNVAVSYTGIN